MKKLDESYNTETEKLEELAKDLMAIGLKDGQDFDIILIEGIGYHLDIVDSKLENLSVMKVLEKYEVE